MKGCIGRSSDLFETTVGMMIIVVLDFSDESVLDMHNLVGLICYTAFVSHNNNSYTLFLVELFQQVDHLHTGLRVERSCRFIGEYYLRSVTM